MKLWNPGEIALVRYRRLGPVSYVEPVTVVEDSETLTRLFLRAGTPIKHPVFTDGAHIPRDISYKERVAIPRLVGNGIWRINHVLILQRPGEAHSIWLFWGEDDWTFKGWYVNLQRPIKRSSVGFDTADHVLDIFINPDFTWNWKDEDELRDAIEIGRFTQDEADELYAEGQRVIARMEARTWPFDTDYRDWRPDPAWPIPAMPDNWDVDQ